MIKYVVVYSNQYGELIDFFVQARDEIEARDLCTKVIDKHFFGCKVEYVYEFIEPHFLTREDIENDNYDI